MASLKFNEEIQLKIIEDYKLTRRMKRTAKNFHTTMDVVRACLKRHNIPIIPQRVISPEEKERVLKMYSEGMIATKIAKIINFSRETVFRILEQNGVELRPKTLSYKKYNLNREYFQVIDTPLKAYFLGLMYADGCISKDTFSIALQDGDEYILEFLAKELKYDGPLANRNPKPNRKRMVVFITTDILFGRILRKHGMFDRKTSKIGFPHEYIKPEYYWPFLLGLGDGDGCVSYGHYGTRFNYIYQFAGSSKMMLDIKNITDSLGIPSVYEGPIRSKGCKLVFHTGNAIKMMNKMYQERLPIFMTRKFDKYKYIVDFVLNNPKSNRKKEIIKSAEEAVEIIKQYA